MIVNIDGFDSQNKIDQLPDGCYVQTIRSYTNYDRSIQATLYEYANSNLPGVPIVYDLTIVLENGDVLFRDFSLQTDGEWRDSYGASAVDVIHLFPPEMTDFRAVGKDIVNVLTWKNPILTTNSISA